LNLIFNFSTRHSQIRIGLAILCAVGLGCAEIAPPPGGEVDKTGPMLVSSIPVDGALEVASLQTIILTFSEKLTKPNKGRGVFMSPRPTFEPEVEWKSNQIHLELAEPLQSDQTYVVSVSSDVTDLRRNRLDSTVTIAFSTGTHIDSGSAAGVVITAEEKPAAGWAIGLYRELDFPDNENADSTYPDYFTNCDPQGRFELKYLPPGDYRLLAFDDKNRDNLFNPMVEAFAVPDREFKIGGDLRLDNLIMTGTEFDSLTPRIISAVATSDGLLRVRLNRPIDPTWLGHQPEKLQITALTDSVNYYTEAILEATEDESSVVTAYVPNLVEGFYRLNVDYSSTGMPMTYDSVHFRRIEDKFPPTLIKTEPSNPTLFAHAVALRHTYSEPIDTLQLTDQTFSLWESDSLLVPITLQWEDRFHLTLTPGRILPAQRYRLDITEFDLVDLSGNQLGDSVRSMTFSTHNADSLGSISGNILISALPNQNASAYFTFQLVGTSQWFDLVVEPDLSLQNDVGRAFSLEVLPGKYLLRGFVDRDGDDKLTPGGIRPFRVSETRAIYPDTIAVRARFETAGIQFNID